MDRRESASGRHGTRPRAFLEDWSRRMDGGPYPAYRDLYGRFAVQGLELEVLRVQPDPFAGPSRVRLLIPYGSTALDPRLGAMPGGLRASEPGLVDGPSSRAVGIRDYLGRWIGLWLHNRAGDRRSALSMVRHGQQMLDRSAVFLQPGMLEVRLSADLPANGRRIRGRDAFRLLVETPERLVRDCLGPGAIDTAAMGRHADAAEDFARLQDILGENDWLAFVADGSRLARRAGNDDRPLEEGEVIPFASPGSMRREVDLPNSGRVAGMAVEPGVTLLCGGGFHGKSTLLRALAAGVVPHVPGDGRELTAVRADATAIRAEDGRAISNVDLSPFLHDLPFGRPTESFSTENASGSTSQAASILEAIQGGSRLLLIDEDTSATNFMIRDPLMEALLESYQEPITPFLAQARTLYEGFGVSAILVIGGSGEYFRVADRVLLLDTYRPHDRTEQARRIASERSALPLDPASLAQFRRATGPGRPLPAGPGRDSRNRRVRAVEPRRLLVGRVSLELDGLETLRDLSQTRFLARFLEWWIVEPLAQRAGNGDSSGSVGDLRESIRSAWNSAGLDAFDRDLRGDLAAVRCPDMLATVNRLRERPAPGTDWGIERE